MQHNLHCAQQLFSKRVPILLQGATGTGKEAFARVLHQAAAWATKPFVAVNCGAIPESLIESELFGYTRGAFTDADRQGRPGKILQSSGGTLFLDEIGDMPLTLQTRLLRVIEEFEIVPLGGDQAVTVDLHVISASHRDIRQMVHDGEFREDLYYRLAGTTLHLPRLRDRADRTELVETLLREETADGDPVRILPDALHALLTYHWPGNIRQLRNVLRTAAALCSDNTIRLSNLPQELLDDAAEGMPAADPPLPLATDGRWLLPHAAGQRRARGPAARARAPSLEHHAHGRIVEREPQHLVPQDPQASDSAGRVRRVQVRRGLTAAVPQIHENREALRRICLSATRSRRSH